MGSSAAPFLATPPIRATNSPVIVIVAVLRRTELKVSTRCAAMATV
jgi:hypothetical protein